MTMMTHPTYTPTADAWSTASVNDYENDIVFRAELTSPRTRPEEGHFDLVIEHLHAPWAGKMTDFGTDVTVKWRSLDVVGLGSWEQFSVHIKDLPDLIAALQLAQAEVTR